MTSTKHALPPVPDPNMIMEGYILSTQSTTQVVGVFALHPMFQFAGVIDPKRKIVS